MKTKADKIASFDPSGFATTNNLFGLPFDASESDTVVVPVPWEVTVSYAAGTASGPEAIAEASLQVDLYDPVVTDAWQRGIHLDEVNLELWETSDKLRKKAAKYINSLADEEDFKDYSQSLEKIDKGCKRMIKWVKERTGYWLDQGKAVALLGGDHSTPLGYIHALAERHKEFGILQIDAHMDLRDAYEGFTYSHASIMFNVLKTKQVTKLVQVGIRDYCQDEVDVVAQSKGRVQVFYDRTMKHQNYEGKSWKMQVDEILAQLPEKVYLSFDIDGLDPKLCPNTGTPVAGGLEAEQVLYLAEQLVASGRTLIGMDLNEVAPGDGDDWDANVASRLLYRLCNLMRASQK